LRNSNVRPVRRCDPDQPPQSRISKSPGRSRGRRHFAAHALIWRRSISARCFTPMLAARFGVTTVRQE